MNLTVTPAELEPGDRIETAVGVTRKVARVEPLPYGLAFRVHYEGATYFDMKYAGNRIDIIREVA